MNILLASLFWVLATLVLFTTLAPLTNSVQWWVRGWDFPRVHIALVGFMTAVLGLYLGQLYFVVASCAVLICSVYQSYRIFPYTPLAKQEIPIERNVATDARVSILSVNVLKENKDRQRLRDLIDREDPDILFLMEIDDAWLDALSDQLARYPVLVSHPKSDHYGAVFASKLPTKEAKTVFLSDDDTPTVLAEINGPTGGFFFVGLHPRPPVPGTDTKARDEQIKRAAQLADRTCLPVVAMGDFNDVAWSWSSERFKRYGAFRDPRVGRGMIPSFDAHSWIMRFPIDQLYLTEGVGLVSFGRLEAIGSDHFPMKAVIVIDRDKASTEAEAPKAATK